MTNTLFHIKSNLVCPVFQCVVSVLSAQRCTFHCVRREHGVRAAWLFGHSNSN